MMIRDSGLLFGPPYTWPAHPGILVLGWRIVCYCSIFICRPIVCSGRVLSTHVLRFF